MRRMLFSWRAALAFVAVVVGTVGALGLRADATLMSDATMKDIHGAGCYKIDLQDGCSRHGINPWCSSPTGDAPWWKEVSDLNHEDPVPSGGGGGREHYATSGIRTECTAAAYSDSICTVYLYGNSWDQPDPYLYGDECQ